MKKREIIETINMAYEIGACDEETRDADIEMVTDFGLKGVTGTVEQLMTIIALCREVVMNDDFDSDETQEEQNYIS